MTVQFWKPNDTCCDCDTPLGDDRVFGMCRPCAEARSAARKARKRLREVVRSHRSVDGELAPRKEG